MSVLIKDNGMRVPVLPATDPTGAIPKALGDQILTINNNPAGVINQFQQPIQTVYETQVNPVNVPQVDPALPSGSAVVDTSVATGNTPMFAALDWIKKNPLAAGAIAVGVGLLIFEATKKKKR